MSFELIIDDSITSKLAEYPTVMQGKITFLYELVIETAQQMQELNKLHITLKWGQISFISDIGSTLRIDTNPKQPDEYAMYFHCQTRLIDTFRLLFENELTFEGNRAIVLKVNDELPVIPLKECIKTALRYHKVKNLDTLAIMHY